jgi:mannose-1-phosphate guanylyltransferase/mannose-6-phosphate isomerase
VEPNGRNTAPAIGLACAHLYRRDPQAIAAFLPADHIIPDVAQFHQVLNRAAEAAAQGYLVTLGITPTMPHTGYGYIKAGAALMKNNAENLPVYMVERFLEKPNRATAEGFLVDGNYFWNAGIFICRVDKMLAAMQQHLPAVYACLQRIMQGLDTPEAAQIFESAWCDMPSISIDYGVMERAQSVAMVPLDAGWNDVGSWDALESVLPQDPQGNYVARGKTLAIDSQGNIVYSDKRIVALIDVQDLVVVETDGALLIGPKHKMQRVREIVEQLRSQGKTELL